MRKIRMIAIAALALIAAQGCKFVTLSASFIDENGGAAAKAEDRQETHTFFVSDFSGISCGMAANIEYCLSEETSVKVEAPESIIERLQLEVSDGVLHLALDDAEGRLENYDCHITICSPRLENLNVYGACDFKTDDKLIGEAFRMAIYGAADAKLEYLVADSVSLLVDGAASVAIWGIETADLNIEVNGAGSIRVSGKADSTSVSVTGAGDVDLSGLETKSFKKETGTSGSIRQR